MKRELMILIAGAAIVMSSCSDQNETITPTPGKDVSFSANLSGEKTRTVYGPDSEGAEALKVYWVEGDRIKVYGTNCVEGRKMSEYSVNTNGAKDLNYAESLNKTGEAGVQWGDEATSDFYAVYPSSNNGKDFTINENNDGSVTISASIRKEQKNIFSLSNGNWISYPYDNNENVLSMPDAIMYARTKGVNNGETVDLQFKPFSTVLKFNIGGYTTNLSDPTLHIAEVTITAPEGVMIAGDFNLNIAQDGTTTVVPSANASNVINIYPTQKGGAYAPVKSGQDMEFTVFVIPQDGLSLNKDWTLKIYSDGGNFSKTLKPANAESADLLAGQIHKLNIRGTTITENPEFDPSKWITQIPRNVYLSELSVPGAWYCTNSEYQNTTDLAEQYKVGVRAFNIDCRLTNQTRKEYPETKNTRFVCAGSDGVSGISSGTGQYTPGDLVIDKLKLLSDLVGEHPKEYIVVTLTIAEQPLYRRQLFGAFDNIIYGTVNSEDVLKAIYDMLTSDIGQSLNIYRDKITPETTVAKVLGKMIVIVNVNTSKFMNYTTVPNTLMASASMASNSDFIDIYTDVEKGVFDKMATSEMYWGKEKTGITYYYHQAQRTYSNNSGMPTIAQRKNAIDEIVQKSNEIYDQKGNSGWYQMGIGGYVKNNDGDSNNRLLVSTNLNTYLLELIEKKLNSQEQLTPSPVGIVLMNYCTGETAEDGNGKALVNAILQMNGKFFLNRNSDPEWPDKTSGDTPTPVQSAKAGYSSGFNVDTENWNAF